MRGKGSQHHHTRLLHLALALLVEIFDPGDLAALGVGEHAGNGRERAHLGAGLARLAQIGGGRIGERADRTADVAPAVIDAGGTALVLGRVHRDRVRHHADAVRREALEPDLTVAEGLHRRHRIGRTGRPPDFLGLGVARHADIGRDLVVIGRDVGIVDRPIERAAVLALDLEVEGQQPREVGEVMQSSAADAPAGLVGVAEGILSFEQERRAGRLDPPSPDIRADEVGELPIRPLLDHHDLLAGLGQHRGVGRARCAGADDGDVHFFVRSHGHHLFSGTMWAM